MSRFKFDKLKYLCVKTHNVTGLKYFCKTERKNPFKYKGSGNKWLAHLNEYGNNFSTEIVFSSYDPWEIRKKGIELSTLWDIVKSTDWANEKMEIGDGGFSPKWSDETRVKIISALKGKSRPKTKATLAKKREERKKKLEEEHGSQRECFYCKKYDSPINLYFAKNQIWHRECRREFKQEKRKQVEDQKALQNGAKPGFKQCKHCYEWGPSEDMHLGVHKKCRPAMIMIAMSKTDIRNEISQGLRMCHVCKQWDDPVNMRITKGAVYHRECKRKQFKEKYLPKKVILDDSNKERAKQIYSKGEISIKELAAQFGITPFRMTKILRGIPGKWGKKNPIVSSKEEKLKKRRLRETPRAREMYRSRRKAMGYSVKLWSKYRVDI